ncbi:uncharacterized protein LOC132036768 isoform X2 [Lycium ferocissimum]|uniref:uncharacterized protein LOC132036768 isoform X2 n=1 Tax=Lycium ferocissimum TaxID=112874 RepID=UPI00281502B9|nr:uncharacterized protein LOC132036768 isoform X2 [Lycium ferocissimum]
MFSISLSLHSLLPPPCHSFWFSSFLSSKSSQDPLAQRRNWQSRGKKKDEQFDIISEARLTVHISRQTFYLTTITSISVTVGYLSGIQPGTREPLMVTEGLIWLMGHTI